MKSLPTGSAARWAPLAATALLLAVPTFSADAQERQWDSGKEAYDKVCGYCHSPSVAVGPSLQGRNLPPEFLTAIVRYGLNAMPAFPESYIDDATIVEVATYLDTLPPVPVPGPAGGAQ